MVGGGQIGCVVEASRDATVGEDTLNDSMLLWVTDLSSPQTSQLLTCLKARGFDTTPHVAASPAAFAARRKPAGAGADVEEAPSWMLREGAAIQAAFPDFSAATSAASVAFSAPPPSAPGGRSPNLEGA